MTVAVAPVSRAGQSTWGIDINCYNCWYPGDIIRSYDRSRSPGIQDWMVDLRDIIGKLNIFIRRDLGKTLPKNRNEDRKIAVKIDQELGNFVAQQRSGRKKYDKSKWLAEITFLHHAPCGSKYVILCSSLIQDILYAHGRYIYQCHSKLKTR